MIYLTKLYIEWVLAYPKSAYLIDICILLSIAILGIWIYNLSREENKTK